jgi:catalase
MLHRCGAKQMTADDPDFHRRDLSTAIATGDAPQWRLEMQIVPFEDASDYGFNPFDLAKVWPHSEYPPIQVGRYAYEKHAADDDFGQPGSGYRGVISDTGREHLVTNIVGHASDEVTAEMQARVIAYWSHVDPDLGARVAAGLGHGDRAPSDGPSAEARELVAARANRA